MGLGYVALDIGRSSNQKVADLQSTNHYSDLHRISQKTTKAYDKLTGAQDWANLTNFFGELANLAARPFIGDNRLGTSVTSLFQNNKDINDGTKDSRAAESARESKTQNPGTETRRKYLEFTQTMIQNISSMYRAIFS